MKRCAFRSTAVAIFLLGASHGSAAQDAALVEIPVDANTPEVMDLERETRNPDFRILSERLSPSLGGTSEGLADLMDDAALNEKARRLGRSPSAVLLGLKRLENGDFRSRSFFAAIDVPRIAARAAGGEAPPGLQGLASRRAVVDRDLLDVEANTIFSPPDEGWFATDYPEIGANLRCDWVYDAKLSEAVEGEEARQREAELETAFQEKATEGNFPDAGPPASALGEDAPEGESTEEGETGIERQFQIAGRPCILTYLCGDERFPCSDGVADELAENVVLISAGSR